MAGKTPWMTTNKLIETVKQRIMVPLSEVTFSDNDIAEFANQELMGSQVPSVLQYHEEYFIQSITVPLEQNVLRYPIPNRAVGMKLRYIFYKDENNQTYDMTRVNPNDQAYFLNNADTSQAPFRYYVENNDIVLPIGNIDSPVGSLVMGFFMRPNQLVLNDQVATITSFQQNITIENSAFAPGDTLTIVVSANSEIVFTAVASNPGANEFEIGNTSTITATNLVNAINTNGVYTASNSNPAVNIVNIRYLLVTNQFLVSNSNSMIIPNTQTAIVDAIPSAFTNSTFYDVMQTLPGHRIINYDIPGGANAIAGNTITLPAGSFPYTTIIGDYISLANECIIPQLPPELHSILAERTCARVLSALGDTDGLNTSNTKISELETRQGNMLQNRVDSGTQKVLNRRSIMHYGKNSQRGPNGA